MGLKLSNIQQYKMTEYESLDSLILSDSSSEGVIKSPHYTYYNKKRSVELIASFNETREPIFCLSFLSALDKIRNDICCEKLFIENISNNNILIKNILNRYSYKEKITTSYYFYNFAMRPFKSTDVIIID